MHRLPVLLKYENFSQERQKKKRTRFYFQNDYRVPGEDLLICCTNEGEVCGYSFSTDNASTLIANSFQDYQEAIRDLAQKKQVI